MSLIKKADVKNHLSARHRSEIHLARPISRSDDSTNEDPKASDSVENTPIPSALSDADPAADVTSTSVKA